MNNIHPIRPDKTSDPDRFPCWLWSKNARQWFRCNAGAIYGNTGGRELYTHWHPDQPTAPTDTPYLAPRPPAPVDAEWARKAAYELLARTTDPLPSYDEVTRGAEKILGYFAAHAPADPASAQLAAMREERDEASNVLYHTRKTAAEAMNEIRAAAGAPDSIADRTKNRAVDYVATLRRERDAWRGLFGAKDGETAEQCRRIWQEALNEQDRLNDKLTALQKERDELRADKERLDWLDDAAHKREVCFEVGKPRMYHETVRDAIDAARATQGEGQP